MKKLFLINLLLLKFFIFVPKCYSQADISMATNWYNRANYNPASIVREDYIYLFCNIQRQWLGVGGSPTVFNVQASQYIYNLHSAFGISLVSDQLGLTSTKNTLLTYAYRISGSSNWSLSMGLSAGIFSRSIDGSQFEPGTTRDPVIYNNLSTTLDPDANLGVEFQSSYFVGGFSTTHLFSIGKNNYAFLNSNHLYSYFIYRNTESELMNFNVGFQMVNGTVSSTLEGNASVRFKRPTGLTTKPREIFDVGLGYKTSKQVLLMLGVNIMSDFRVGYVYDQSFSIGFNANSTHEIMLEYRIPSKVSAACNCKTESYWY